MIILIIQDGGYYDILVQLLDLLHSNYSENVWGVIGPGDDPDVASFIASIAENLGLITVRNYHACRACATAWLKCHKNQCHLC